jgi:hypothetical protein
MLMRLRFAPTCSLIALAALGLLAGSAHAVTIDFEGEANGQQIFGSEFAGVTITSPDGGTDPGDSSLGPAIFNTTPAPTGPNKDGDDKDLLVGTGNALILQSKAHPSQTGTIFDTPNDEAAFSPTGEGHINIGFDSSIELVSLNLIDVNGGVNIDLLLTDSGGNTKLYEVPQMWTLDVSVCGVCDGYKTIDLQTLLAQVPEAGATGLDVPVPTITGAFDLTAVDSLLIRFHGLSPSAAVDDLVFVPEPSTALLIGLGLVGFGVTRRRS